MNPNPRINNQQKKYSKSSENHIRSLESIIKDSTVKSSTDGMNDSTCPQQMNSMRKDGLSTTAVFKLLSSANQHLEMAKEGRKYYL